MHTSIVLRFPLSSARPALRRSGVIHKHPACISTRTISTLDPVIRDFATTLAEKQPCYSIPAQNVDILQEPSKFYDTLLNMIRHARHRVFLSSLYTGEREHELIDTLHTALKSNESLRVNIHLDLNRTTRPGAESPVKLLVPLVEQHPERVNISLFRSPALGGVLARLVPPRFNEGWGTWHAKIYGADNDVMISGANLNKSYFTNRQDRYVRFSGHERLANYCYGYLDAASTFSYRLLSAPGSELSYNLDWTSSLHPHRFQQDATNKFNGLQAKSRSDSTVFDNVEGNVFVFPVLQAGQFKVREEVECLTLLFEHLQRQQAQGARPVVDLTSGYFGLSDQYRRLVLESNLECRILAASPKANGFYGSRGVSGRVPEGYTLLEQRFMRDAARLARLPHPSSPHHPSIRLSEWARPGWTYHAKGVWVRPAADEDPVFTLVGSTNLSARSVERDTELSFALLTGVPAVRAKMAEEVSGLWQHAEPWKGAQRKVRLGTKVLVALVGNML